MGTVVLSLASVTSLILAPLHAIVGFFAPWQSAGGGLTPGAVDVSGHRCATNAPAALVGARADESPGARGRLRVLRVFEATTRPDMAGRMVISGRMADVCAELERMSQRAGSASPAQERHIRY